MNESIKQLAERYLIDFSGGIPSDDSKVDIRFFISEINKAIAIVAKNSMMESANLEGIAYASDQFISTYRNISITKNDTLGEWYIVLPDIPVGLPKSRGLVNITPPIGYGNTIKAVALKDVPILLRQDVIPGTYFYWLEGGIAQIWPRPLFDTVNSRMISPPQDIDAPLTIPPDAVAQLYDIVKKSVMDLFNIEPDKINDGEPK